MKDKKRKKRIDSIGSIVTIAAMARLKSRWPAGIRRRKGDSLYFNALLNEFSSFELSVHKVQLCALLAISMNDLIREQKLLYLEGSIVNSPNGKILNPRKSSIQMLTNSILSLRRSLGIHALAKDGRGVQKRREIAKSIELTMNKDYGDLMPRMS